MSKAQSVKSEMTNHTEKHNLQNTLSARLKYTLEKQRLSQSDLARKIRIKPQVIQYICANNVKKSQFTYEIAKALDVDYVWLATGQGLMKTPTDSQTRRSVPVIKIEDVKAIALKKMILNDIKAFQWFTPQEQLQENCFACLNTDNAMELKFPIGSTLVFDPQQEIANHDYMLVYVKALDQILFRQALVNKKQIIAAPLETSLFNDYNLTDGDKVVGKLILLQHRFK